MHERDNYLVNIRSELQDDSKISDQEWAKKHEYEVFSMPGISVIPALRVLSEARVSAPPPQENDISALFNSLIKELTKNLFEPIERPLEYGGEIRQVLYYSFLRWPHEATTYFIERMHGWSENQFLLLDILEETLVRIDADAAAIEHGTFQGEEVHEWQRLCNLAIGKSIPMLKEYLVGAKDDPATRYILVARTEALIRDIYKRSTGDYEPFQITKGVWAAFTHNHERIKVGSEAQISKWSGRRIATAEVINHAWTVSEIGGLRDTLLDAGYEIEELLDDAEKHDRLMVGNLKSCLKSATRSILQEDFHFDLTQFSSVRELIYFLDYIPDAAISNQHMFRALNQRYGSDFMRTFLSVSVDKRVRGEIVALAQNADQVLATNVFNVFAAFADQVDTLEEYLLEKFGVQNRQAVHALSERLLLRGRKLLGRAHELRHNPEKLAELIQNINTTTESFADACRVLYEQGELKFESIADGGVIQFTGADKSEHMRELTQMEQLLDTDAQGPDAVFATSIKGMFRRLVHEKSTRVYGADWQNKVQTFMAFSDIGSAIQPAHTLKGTFRGAYFGFFRSGLKGGKLGEALLELALRKEIDRQEAAGVEPEIHAYCGPTIPIAQKYFELGFVADSFFNKSGVDRLHISLQPVLNSRLLTKRLGTREELEDAASKNPGTIKFVTATSAEALPFSLLENGEGWLLTRVQYKAGDCYAVFEKSPV